MLADSVPRPRPKGVILEGDPAEETPGMIVETKDLYKRDASSPWQEWAPEDVSVGTDLDSFAKFALIVRRRVKTEETDDNSLGLHSIVVQSPLIKKQLVHVFEGYRGVNTSLKKLKFRAPFHEFFFRWGKFLEAKPTQKGAEETHYQLLFNVISAEIRPHVDRVSDLLENNVITFDYIWALFEPESEVYSIMDNQDRLLVLENCVHDESSFGLYEPRYELSCRYIDTDGETFGYGRKSFVVKQFDGMRAISELEVIPSRLVPDIDEIRKRLVQRGKEFECLKGFHHKAYSDAYDPREQLPAGQQKQHSNDERVIVDCESFFKYSGDKGEPLVPLDQPFQSRDWEDTRRDPQIPLSILSTHNIKSKPGRLKRETVIGVDKAMKKTDNKQLSENHYLLCVHYVRGFHLKSGRWGYLSVDRVRPISWDEDTFDRLVLRDDYKRMIRAFVEAQTSELDDFDDVIPGKGKGIIMLLSGEPGTGKTLTSESVAETMGKPLYSMSAGELGDSADDVEENLDRVLKLSTKWGAVLLLDECDVFLEARSSSDLPRNKLVTIFLRLLEYYQGIMFLTTNRADSFDPAFESRIHLTINYPPLNFEGRLQIWRTFLKRDSAGGNYFSENDLARLASVTLNGRQIKNVVKTARLLAASGKTPLAMGEIRTVLQSKGKDIGGSRTSSLMVVRRVGQKITEWGNKQLKGSAKENKEV